MSVYLGVDFHAGTQAVCWCDTADGLIRQRTLDHQQDDVRGFYAQFPAPAIVGLEATGYARWRVAKRRRTCSNRSATHERTFLSSRPLLPHLQALTSSP